MARLLSKAEMALAGLVDKDPTRMGLGCVHVTEKYSEVTNGHYLVRVPACPMDPKDFPKVPGMGSGAGELLIRGEALAAAAKAVPKKSRIPIVETLHIGKDESGQVVTTSTDLESPCIRKSMTSDVTFPQTDKVIPTEGRDFVASEVKSFVLSAAYLKQLAAYVEKHGEGRAPAITFTVKDANSPVRMEFMTEDGQQALIVLMPVALPKSEAFSGVVERKAV